MVVEAIRVDRNDSEEWELAPAGASSTEGPEGGTGCSSAHKKLYNFFLLHRFTRR